MDTLALTATRGPVVVEALSPEAAQAHLDELSAVLCDCVEGGASVSFMLPFPASAAQAYWTGVVESVGRGERILLAALDGHDGAAIGTVQVVLEQPPNQPHRADISKLLVHRSARSRGVGQALMEAADSAAATAGKTLLVLDTASETAERLYERCGWTRVGTIPGYALLPGGGLCDTVYFYKQLA
ncbi:GNAT family N-acetyltransferase [Phenylobacterium deserti]|uniref:GNAT family N-acetyltransferase n=1 Tax=Phenylobacterium deserti TaxID=1914756 RepID=A0A328AQG3_9CAUL|nr:GNAT family N-acetyltransferase [Phenylobacterium deserti]RAK56551.1 GNAT family N-acetyltransferase [Phenylobacterium deserti]